MVDMRSRPWDGRDQGGGYALRRARRNERWWEGQAYDTRAVCVRGSCAG